MRILSKFLLPIALMAMTAITSCDNTRSYAELLSDENRAVNAFLVNQRIEETIPADTIFETGINAPYYQLDNEGNVFMQVLNPGTKGYKATYGQLIYFRFMRYSLYTYTATDKNNGGYYGEFSDGTGNDSDLTAGSYSFRFDNLAASSSQQWGAGLQMPLRYLPIDCEVNLVLKSQYGLYSEIANVTPFFYKVRYFKSQI